MRTSQLFLPTLKETPADAELVSHQLMLRAGLIRKLASGLYTWLPLGLRVLQKVERIVREEMNKIGGQELMIPLIQPAELWEESKRWDIYGPDLLKIRDRHERLFCFSPTCEEAITDLLRHELRSYKQLPATFYQIHMKFRDEIRPRFGVMRAREFLMKDAYSFHADKTSLEKTYQDMYSAYTNVFTRLGLDFRAVHADSGSIGGSVTQEFQVLAHSGEDVIFFSDQSDYAANVEQAEAVAPNGNRPAPTKTMEEVLTPGKRTIADVSDYLKMGPKQSVKVLLVKGELEPLIALVLRGDHELNTIKAEKLPQIASPLTFADEKDIEAKIGCPVGYLGPVGLNVPIIIDRAAAHLADFVCGANKENYHLMNVNWERDVPLTTIADLRKVVAGDPSPDGKGTLQMARGIEVGHIFQLGTKYSESMHATVTAEDGREIPMEMGCYGIGVSRIVAAAIEQNHDERGIKWPVAMAPFQIALVPINYHRSENVRAKADELYQQFTAAGFEIIMDDRNERPGVMFADMELIGIPYRITISERTLEKNSAEFLDRKTGEKNDALSLDDIKQDNFKFLRNKI